MSRVGAAIDRARARVAAKASKILPDVCNLWGPTFVDGGSSGDSETIAVIASDIPVGYRGSRANSQIVIGGEAYVASHQLQMPLTAVTTQITPKYFIKVQPRGETQELVFEKPVIVHSANDIFLTVAATLVQQGFNQ
jgi:hypothetical protein